MKKLEKVVRNLCDKDNEQEWFEFKEKRIIRTLHRPVPCDMYPESWTHIYELG